MTASGDAEEVLHLEEELLWTGGPHARDRLDELLDPGFVELGASGRRWERAAVITAVVRRQPPFEARVDRSEVVPLAEGVVLLTYRAVVEGRSSLRSSVWLRSEAGWRLRFHQGTPIPDEVDT